MTVAILIVALILFLCVLLNKVFNRIGIPMLLAFILLGLVFGTDGIFKIEFENYAFSEQICSIALIFIMFYGGFGTKWSQAKPVALKAGVLSTLGVVCTAGFVGMFCYFILRIDLLESLLIGSVISSTDAASVFSILRSKKLGLKYHTASMLEIESGSNDPCSYMLTILVLSAMSKRASASNIMIMVFEQFTYGIVIGLIIAGLSLLILRKIHFATAGFNMAFVIAVALLSYALPTLVGGNGYLSVYIVGIIIGNGKIKEKQALVHFFDGVTGLMQILIFFLLGLLATPSKIPSILIPAIAIALFLTFIARPLSVFLVLQPARCNIRQQLLVSFSGLRGAASIVFAIMATVNEAYMQYDVFHIVFCIVLFSILFQGAFISVVAKKLDMIDEDTDVLKTFNDYSDALKVQFVKLVINDNHPWKGKSIEEVEIPPDTLLVMIVRGTSKVIPDGKTLILEGDILILSGVAFMDEMVISLEEYEIEEDSKWKGKMISEFSPNPGELVIIIKRGDHIILPRGDTKIEEQDVLVLNGAKDRA